MNNPTALEITLFRFITWNNPLFHQLTKLVKYKLTDILTVALMKSVKREITHTKKELQKNINMGIITGQISVMRLDLNSKTKYKHIQRLLK